MTVRASLTRIVAASVILVALVASYWVFSAYSFERTRADLLEESHRRATRLAEAARQQFDATLNGADQVLQDVRSNLTGMDRAVDNAARTLALLPAAGEAQVAIYDHAGRLIEATGSAPLPADISGRAYFTRLKTSGRDELVLGEAEHDPQIGRWLVPLARPIRNDADFDGLVLLALSPLALSEPLAQIVLGGDDVVGVLHLPDATYLARSEAILSQLGKTAPAEPDGPVHGVSVARDPEDGVERIHAWSRSTTLPFATVVGLSVADVFRPLDAEIARHNRTGVLGTLALLGLAAPLAFLAWRSTRQREALIRQEALYHALFDQNHSIKLLVDPEDGRILQANAAAIEFYGYARGDLVGKSISEINCLPPDDIRRAMARAREGQRRSFIFPHRLASGEIRMVEVFSSSIRAGDREALYSIIHDVTERFELERSLRNSEQRYRTIFESVPAGLVFIEENGTVAAWNTTALDILRVSADELQRRAIPLCDRDGQPIEEAHRPSHRCLSEEFQDEIYTLKLDDGRTEWININGRPVDAGPDGGPRGGVLAFTDITRTVQIEEELLISERVFETALEGIIVMDLDFRIVRVNPAFTELTGYEAEEVVGRPPDVITNGPQDPAFWQATAGTLNTTGTWVGEVVCRRKDGRRVINATAIRAIRHPDGKRGGYVALFSDVTERALREKEAWHRANLDALTGLPNRTLFSDRLHQALVQSRRSGRTVAVLFIDLDKFKPVNDRWGHATGDELLRKVAVRLSEAVRDEDTVARLGGDEFVVLMPSVVDTAAAVLVAERLLELLSAPFRVSGTEQTCLSACVGVAVDTGGTLDPGTLIDRADKAMYLGKTGGRSRVAVFEVPVPPRAAADLSPTGDGVPS